MLQAYLADAVLSLKATPMSAMDKRQLRAFRCVYGMIVVHPPDDQLPIYSLLPPRELLCGVPASKRLCGRPPVFKCAAHQSVPDDLSSPEGCNSLLRRKRALASSSCAELVFDEYFEGLWSVK